LGLVGGVGVAWLLTFVLMGGDVLPALSSSPSHPSTSPTPSSSAQARTGPTAGDTPTAGPTTTAPTGTTSTGSLALSAESLATIAPVKGPVLAARPKPRRSTPPVLDFRLSTFNVLGASHTTGKSRRASGSTRMARATSYVLDHSISVVGFQEMQSVQRSTFLSRTGNAYGLYPGGSQRSGDGDTSIAWRKDTWDLVDASTVSIPYFHGRPRNLPVLLLRNKQTGIRAYFTNFHNPADKYGNAQGLRNIGKKRQIALFQDLNKKGYPVFATGDMNEHRSWACEIVGPSDMRAAAGGDGRNGCSVSTNRIVDWITGSYDVTFSNYTEDRSGLVASITDHPVIYTDVRIDSRDFPKSVD
ncbi:MAG: endonuclease/exonuclease/phosphatase family protein, partial [Marmoricola sp.]